MAEAQDVGQPGAPPILGNEPVEENRQPEVTKKKGVKKKVFINEDLFGSSKTLEDIPPDEGIAHLKIKAQELGNIPGLIEHWRKEIENRTSEIIEYRNQTFLQKTRRFIKKEKYSTSIFGEELAYLHPTREALEKVKLLRRDPTNMMARLELVAIVAKSGREFTVENFRTFLLEATVACSFGVWSNIGLQTVIWTQDLYFSKLFYKCKGEAQALESKIKLEQGKENAFTRQSVKLRKHIADVTRNMEIIKNYQKQSDKALKENKSIYDNTLSLDEITDFLLEGTSRDKESGIRDEKYLSILKRASEILLLLRVLPLLDTQAKKLSDQLKKLDKNDPFVHFLEAKVAMCDLIFKVGQYQGGEHSTALRTAIQDSFKSVLNSYGLAVKRVGKLPKTKTEHTIYIEYANLIHYFYKVSKTTLGLHLPKEWLETVFTKAMKMLAVIQDTGHVDGLIKDLERDMHDENIEVNLR